MLIAASHALETHAFHAKFGAELIKLFDAVPEACKKKVNSAITTQCPDPRHPVPGTCTMHASSVDLSKTLQTIS
jgi:hypothetical protein